MVFLDVTPKTQARKEKIEKLDCIKNKKVFRSKETIKEKIHTLGKNYKLYIWYETSMWNI